MVIGDGNQAEINTGAEGSVVFTIGHSTTEASEFNRILLGQKVELLIDVRSQPASGRFPQFNGSVLERELERSGIGYLFLGEELGGRPDDPAVYSPEGVVDYRARRRSYAFICGIERVERESQSRQVVLMCAEEDPIECHRFLMICPELVALKLRPMHLRRDGSAETQETAEDRLLHSAGFAEIAANTLFPEARAEAIERALELQARKHAFRVDPHLVERW